MMAKELAKMEESEHTLHSNNRFPTVKVRRKILVSDDACSFEII